MTGHKTGTREQWRAARLELLEAEKELTRRGDEVSRRRQELPWVQVDKEYRFETDEGTASLTAWCAISGGPRWPGGLAGGYRAAARSETSPATARKVSSKSSRRPR